MKSSAFAKRHHLLHRLMTEHPDGAFPLDAGACAIASPHRPNLNPRRILETLDQLAATCRKSVQGEPSPKALLEAIRQTLFVELGFSGNEQDYYAPENSFIDCVLETRKGIPITLSIVMIEVARRLGIHLCGIGLPCHFLVGHRRGGDLHLYDPFHGGEKKTPEQCIDMVHLLSGGNITLTKDLIEPASPRSILVRMLMNLRGIYRSRQETDRLVIVLEQLLTIGPDEASIHGELAASLADQGNLEQAHRHLEIFSRMVGEDRDRYRETEWMRQIRTKFSAYN